MAWLLVLPQISPAAPNDSEAVRVDGYPMHPTRILAQFKKGESATSAQGMLAGLGVGVRREYRLVPGSVCLEIMDKPAAKAAPDGRQRHLLARIEALKAAGLFDYVEPDPIVQTFASPSDSYFRAGDLWGLWNKHYPGIDIGATNAWEFTTGSPEVIVAVIDSGIRYTHRDLAAQMWRNPGEIPGNGVDDDGNGYVDDIFGINARAGSGDPMDDNGHGTHVAGTIGAAANDGNPHVGVAWQVRLMACKFLDWTGTNGLTSDAIECINYTVAKGAKILNSSWGGTNYNRALSNAIVAARDAGVLFVAAAGNGGEDGIPDDNDVVPTYPASYTVENVISVASMMRYGVLSSFSNYGQNSVHLAAPGSGIESCFSSSDWSYNTLSGTSMAAPHVSGIAALVRAMNPGISVTALRQAILSGTVFTPSLEGKVSTGGRANAYGALVAADMNPPTVTFTNPVAGQIVSSLARIGGRVVDNLRQSCTVSLTIKETGDGVVADRWWNGLGWQGNPAVLHASVTDTNWFWSSSLLPELRCGGSCVLTATATDPRGNAASAAITVLTDSTPPTLAITSHTNQQVVAALTHVSGMATDSDGDIAAVTLAVRGFDSSGYPFGWWNGASFQPTFASLPCVLGGAGGPGQPVAWSIAPSVMLPCPAPGDAYELVAWSSCTNSASVTVHVQRTVISDTPGTDGPVYALAVQSDGRFLAGGDFTSLRTTLGNWARQSVGRVLPAGTVDSFFNAAIEPDALNGDDVFCLAVQADGKLLLGGQYFTFDWSQQPYLARVHSDGWLDWGFSNWQINGPVRALAVQPDGKIIVASEHSSQRLRRLLADGALDTIFAPSADGRVNCVAVQADGKILVGGLFTTLNGQPRQYLGRLHSNGSLDATTQTNQLAANGEVRTIVVQPDGKIIVGGDFTSIGGQNHNRLARLEPGGTVEPWFNTGAGANGPVESIALQADGRIVVGGGFSQLHGESREGLGRLLADGSLDSSFDSLVWNTYGTVHALALQADGTLIVGGDFGQTWYDSNLRRLETVGRASQCFSRSGNRITWLRGGASPEFWRTTFEYSTNGMTWLPIGVGTRIAGGWERAGVSAPANANLRARGWTTGGRGNGSAWFIEALIAPPIINLQPVSQVLCPGPGQSVSFTVSAAGSGPFTYQWRKNGLNLTNGPAEGCYVQDATTATIQLSGLAAGAAGAYDVVVANSLGSVASATATLTIAGPPVIMAQPPTTTGQAGESVVLGVSVSSARSCLYRWRKEGLPLDGQTNAWLTLTNLQRADAGSYDVVLDNGCGSVTSGVAVVTVNLALADAFDPQISQYVLALAPEPDGRVLVGGYAGLLGQSKPTLLAHLKWDGGVEPDFALDAQGSAHCLARQPGDNLWAGGAIWLPGVSNSALVRLQGDGSLAAYQALATDSSGSPFVRCLVRQADGKLLVGGQFGAIGGRPRLNLARLNADGSVDEGFAPQAEGWAVSAFAVQPDGRILVGGDFQRLAGQACVRLGRLLPNGVLDGSFVTANAKLDNYVACLAVQPDGRILVGTAWAGFSRTNLIRLLPNGVPDPEFNPVITGQLPSPWEGVTKLALQADGKIFMAGQFTSAAGLPRTNLARLHPDGTPDLTFAPDPDTLVCAIALEAGGGVLTSGYFNRIGGQPRSGLARLVNPDAVTNGLTFTQSTITWRRGGAAPEVWRTTFDGTTDGANWLPLGTGTRIPEGWQLTGLSLPPQTWVRARGLVGAAGGSDYFVESFAPHRPIQLAAKAPIGADTFELSLTGVPGDRYEVLFSTNLEHWATLSEVTNVTGALTVPLPQPDARGGFFRVRLMP